MDVAALAPLRQHASALESAGHGMSSSSTTNAPASGCPPLVRRAHKAMVVGLAVFFAMILGLGETFRGYQAEVRVRGPKSEALDTEKIREWITKSEPRAAVAVARGNGGESNVEIRIGRVASRVTEATAALDDLARRLLAEELPRQHAAHRQTLLAQLQADLQTAREAEDGLRGRAAELREERLALEGQSVETDRAISEATSASDLPDREAYASRSPEMEPGNNSEEIRSRLEALRLELARLLASFTDEHPQVLALKRQIDSLENERQETNETGSATGTPGQAASYGGLRDTSFVASIAAASGDDPELVALRDELSTANAELARARAIREASERKLQSTLASLSLNSPAAHWSAEPARIVARLGGTPRMLPLSLAILASLIAGVLMFRATRVLAAPRVLQTLGDLAAALPVPLVGQAPSSKKNTSPAARALVTPGRVRLVTKVSEIVLLTILAICLVTMCLDPPLGGQFVNDPLGVLAEIAGRARGR